MYEQKVEEFLSKQRIMMIGVVDVDGKPWAVPVGIAGREGLVFEWVSGKDTRHSQAIVHNAQVSICVFQGGHDGEEHLGFYGDGEARCVGDGRYSVRVTKAWCNGSDRVKRDLDIGFWEK